MQAPSEFRYHENQSRTEAKLMRLAFRLLYRARPELPEDVVAALARDYYKADPVAERFVDEVYLGRGAVAGRAMLEQALAGGVDSVPDAPESLRALFREIEVRPDWYDAEAVALGARAFRRYGSTMFSFLGAITLEAYSENSVAKPLVLTGAYAGDTTLKRFLETVGFWIDVTEPDALAPGGNGLATALRVRIMHVFVRRQLLKHPEWKAADWGVPISVGDALSTLVAGSFVPGAGLKLMGYRPTDAEIDAMLLFWRYAGFLMGVQPSWYPETRLDAARYMYFVFTKGVGRSGDDGTHLCRSYVEAMAPRVDDEAPLAARLRQRLEHFRHLSYVSTFVSPATRRRHGLPGSSLLGLYVLGRFPLVFAWETVRRHVPAADQLHDRVARRERRAWLARHLGGEAREYSAVTQFTR